MKIIVRVLTFILILFLGVSLSYILVSCTSEPVSAPGEISMDILPVLPVVKISQADYEPVSMQNAFENTEIHTRFSKAYRSVYTPSLKESMIELVSITIKKSGGDGDNFLACLNSIENQKDQKYLPCIVESAKYEGKDAWIMVFNWGSNENDLGHIAFCAVEKSTQKMLYWSSCR